MNATLLAAGTTWWAGRWLGADGSHADDGDLPDFGASLWAGRLQRGGYAGHHGGVFLHAQRFAVGAQACAHVSVNICYVLNSN